MPLRSRVSASSPGAKPIAARRSIGPDGPADIVPTAGSVAPAERPTTADAGRCEAPAPGPDRRQDNGGSGPVAGARARRTLRCMTEGRVIVVGSVNVDLVVRAPRLPSPGDTVIGTAFERHGGGKGANKACAASRAGAPTIFIGAVGLDQAGDEALDELAAEGVDVARCLRLADVATGVALIVVDAQGDNQIAVAAGANGRLDGPAVAAALEGVDGGPADVLLTDFEVGPDAVQAALRWAVERGVRVVVNPAPTRPIDHAIMDARAILTPNASEAVALSGAEDQHAAAYALAERSGAPVIVTLGANGALLVDAGREVHVAGLAVAAVDTTGAGDALNGILCAALAHGDDLETALRWATAGASLSTTVNGARGGLPRAADIDRSVRWNARAPMERPGAAAPDPGQAARGPLEAAVAVQAREEEVAEVGEEHGAEADDEDERRRPARPAALVARVQVDRVDEPRHERRGLLRVPAPVAAPGDRRPVRARGRSSSRRSGSR